MTTAHVYHPNVFALPWATGRDDRRRFERLLAGCLLVVGVMGTVIPFLGVPEPSREAQESLPPQLARLVLERSQPVIPPPPEPPVKEQREKAPQPVPEPEPQARPEPTVAEAREKAATAGLLAFRDAFADMRETVDVAKLQDTAAIQRGSGEAARIDRSVLTSSHSRRSAGVDVAALSRDTGGVALSGRETTRVAAPEGAVGDGGVRERRQADPRSRSIEEIRRIFDANKGAIFAIYNRALRSDPTLQGKVVLELVIAPSGRVTDVRVVASELADEDLVAKILSRIRLFDFGRRDVGVTTISYPVHFLPS